MTTDEVLERIRQADALEYDGGPITAPSYFAAKESGRHCGAANPRTGGSSGSCPCGDEVVAELT